MATTNYRFLTVNAVLYTFFSCIPFFLNHREAIDYSPYNFLILELILFLIVFSINRSEKNRFLLSPSFIVVSYVNVNFMIGSWVFSKGLVDDFVLIPYKDWSHVNLTLIYFNLANLLIVMSYFFARRFPALNFKSVYDLKRVKNKPILILALLLILLFSFVPINLSFLGGDGSFHIILKSLGAILIFVTLFRSYRFSFRIICYAVVILIFAFSAYEDKRDAIFLLLPIFLLESTRYPFTLGIKNVILGSLGVTFCIYLILVMSILRGYGGYQVTGFLDATKYVKEYVTSDFFLPSFMNNIEVSYTYFHSNNSVEIILENPDKLSYGSTLIKPLFLPFPRRIFPKKPDSIIQLYTSAFSPEMRERGVSWPVCIQSEMFWNFHFFGILAGGIIFLFFNSVYLRIVALIKSDDIINYTYLLYIYQQSLVLFRGSGMDQYIIDVILSTLFFFLLKIVIRTLAEKSKSTIKL